MTRDEQLAGARARYQGGDWEQAFALLSRADAAAPLEPDDLERLAWSAGLCGRDGEMVGALERLHHALAEGGACARAARAAFWIGFRLASLGELARARGWLGRAQRLVERHGQDCVEQGYLLLPVVAQRLGAGDDRGAGDAAARAAAIGERFDDADLVSFARNLEGRALIRSGQVAEGLALLDETMIAVTSGELSPLIAGLTYCSVIATCQQVFAVDRAREWTEALSAWCDAQPELGVFTGTCQVHRAELLQLGGAWTEAIEETERASARLSPTTDPAALADAHYQRAEIHRMRGDEGAAEEAYRRASELGGEVQPGLALLRLGQARIDEAAAAIRRVLDTTAAPWRRARFLPACVEIALAAGRRQEAERACAELEEMAGRSGIEILGAMAAHARGALCLSAGDPRGAVAPLRRAFSVWQRAGAPYIAARSRVLVGRACLALGDRDGARLELDAARRVFADLGAAPAIAALDALERGEEPRALRRRHGLSQRELQVLRLIAAGKTNKTIAAELCLSERTVDRHASNIFNKLDVSSRAAATAFAYEHGLV